MKFSKWIGIAFCIILIISCFLPWSYYADIDKTFTGFFSEKNAYGKPGKFMTFFAAISAILFWLPKLWAKRTQLFLSALMVGYAIKTYVLYTSCYNAYCPEKKFGIYLMMISTVAILVVSIFPSLTLSPSTKDRETKAPS